MYTRERREKERKRAREREGEKTCNLTVMKETQVKNVTKKGVGGTERKKISNFY